MRTRVLVAFAASVVIGLAVVVAASAHIERASYWPDPAPDNSVSPPAGGKVPAVRTLGFALNKRRRSKLKVVCQGRVPSQRRVKKARRKLRSARRHHASRQRINTLKRRIRKAKKRYRIAVRKNRSIRRLRGSIAKAKRQGYKFRPSEPTRRLTRAQGTKLYRLNKRLLARCRYHEIQPAVKASGNNATVVIMPGIYTEPTARKQPTNDRRCANLRILNDRGEPVALSYAFQFKCPNDQNLIAVMGRAPGGGADPREPRWDRHGIPNLGRCIRCNMQIQGSGVGAGEVVIDAGRVASGDHAPIGPVKDVGIRADRADGFVLRKVTVRHAREHGIYVLEGDGYRLERFRAFYSGEYGVLTFVEDHGLMQDCDAAGHGDAGLYPGAAAETGQETREGQRRYNQEIRFCDIRHNAGGYSGTAANAVHIHHNDFYGNALGFTTDVFTAAGHPGFPQDSDLIEHNNFYSNNFNPYVRGSDVVPTVPLPVGTGLWVAGGNNNNIRNNRFWDNWRRGTMLFTVPDEFVCGDQPVAGGNHQAGCQENGKVSTSFDNRHVGNVMGRRPDGTRDRNGTDFWWDQYPNQQDHSPPTTTGNCWFKNTGTDGTEGSITSTPPRPFLPSDCSQSVGTAGPINESELLNCFAAFQEGAPAPCTWFTTPQEP